MSGNFPHTAVIPQVSGAQQSTIKHLITGCCLLWKGRNAFAKGLDDSHIICSRTGGGYAYKAITSTPINKGRPNSTRERLTPVGMIRPAL